MTRNFFISTGLILVLFLVLPTTVSAAEVSITAVPEQIGVGDMVQVKVLVTSMSPVNAFSGALHYDTSTLEPMSVSDGNSVVNMWVDRPVVSISADSISYAGITPGGFSGSNGLLFSVVFRAKKSGATALEVSTPEVLRNDGTGGEEEVRVSPLRLSINPKSLGGYTEPADTIPPEPFTVYEGNDPQLFSGKEYISYATVDKGAGIDRYVIVETRVPTVLWWLFPPRWSVKTSPYLFADQERTSAVYVKAIDRAGNERLSVFPLRHLFTSYEMGVLLAILIGAVLLWKVRWGRRLT